ncbi:MAG: dihydrofolate reductase [Bacteroidia bacterium]|nr:dihydrofolate reductase [Bacteroidia bacterium]MBT8269544.1 dihydrofolate reductase [Bacteroidia bacterium]NNK70035.1 Pr2TM family membrane protein [Flavobacteriaceae bacterium]NNL80164.1 Pr2TM family membrane protein [Flavobacteriaceae bacterium]
MLGRKKAKPQVDQEQLELFKTAQRRIKQKRRLYYHFIVFLIGAVLLILANTVLGIGQDFTLFGREWFVFAIGLWILLLLYHILSVFIINRFLGKEWEQQQLDKLVSIQQQKIDKIKKKLEKEEKLMVESIHREHNVVNDGTHELTIIVAAGENDAIGKDNQLIWHLSDDLKRFKSLTSGHHIIMGRKTFESFPKPLPNRTHIVITRQTDYQVPAGVIVVNSFTDALEKAKGDPKPFVIGGGEIYSQAMPYAQKIELTRVHHSFEGADTFFPKIDSSIWKEENCVTHDKDEDHEYAFSFMTYVRG